MYFFGANLFFLEPMTKWEIVLLKFILVYIYRIYLPVMSCMHCSLSLHTNFTCFALLSFQMNCADWLLTDLIMNSLLGNSGKMTTWYFNSNIFIDKNVFIRHYNLSNYYNLSKLNNSFQCHCEVNVINKNQIFNTSMTCFLSLIAINNILQDIISKFQMILKSIQLLQFIKAHQVYQFI